MRIIELESEFHRRHFELFRQLNHPHFSICANVEVGSWVARAKAAGCRLTSSFAYLLARVGNGIPQFRQRIRDDRIVEPDCGTCGNGVVEESESRYRPQRGRFDEGPSKGPTPHEGG